MPCAPPQQHPPLDQTHPVLWPGRAPQGSPMCPGAGEWGLQWGWGPGWRKAAVRDTWPCHPYKCDSGLRAPKSQGTEGAGAPSPTMLPCLLLTLALLSSASARHPGQDTQCPSESETRALHVPNTLGAISFRYIFVARHQAFDSAQQTCIQCYRGNLASIHSHHINTFLQRQARCHIAGTSQLWIGAITQRLAGKLHYSWTDGSLWNYSQWQFGHPQCLVSRCTTLSSQDGLWRSVRCNKRLPYICEY
ncbi:bone marrow proteoglycan isoform X2 [Falco naumanni]|uniref:bone marrow proteoglycan isoform X2 n=1 Tax=Falco naumanni TaxID=148594 RepID=UPI001ADE2D87|nr:bone marrow proteoglycan isoform X2 [Falco naumanni]